ncbi:hypothetical protein Salat_3001000, partial [Sesamum alatum]
MMVDSHTGLPLWMRTGDLLVHRVHFQEQWALDAADQIHFCGTRTPTLSLLELFFTLAVKGLLQKSTRTSSSPIAAVKFWVRIGCGWWLDEDGTGSCFVGQFEDT